MKADPHARVSFTVYNIETGDIVRSGHCPVRDVELQTGGKAGLAVLPGVRGCDVQDRVIMPAKGGKHYLRRRPAAEIEARRPKEPDPATMLDPLAVLLEALRAKGIDLGQAELEAAAGALQARRITAAGVGKQPG